MSTTPPPPPPGPPEGYPPPPPQGPWASDNIPPHPGAYDPEVERPASIVTAVRLMWAGAVITVIGALSVFVQTDALRDNIRERDSSMTSSDVDAAVAGVIGFTIVVGAIIVGLWLWMAHQNGQGRSWARTVATVLGVLNVLFVVVGLAAGNQTGLGVAFNLVNIVLAVVILVLLYRPDASDYYTARSRIA
jgi:hypothetical protein